MRTALEADPVEDGYTHAVEALLEKAIGDSGERAGDWLIAVLTSDRWTASHKAGLVRMLSRQKPLTEEWRLRVIGLGLSSPVIELRDAAVQAAESLEGAASSGSSKPIMSLTHGWLTISRVLSKT